MTAEAVAVRDLARKLGRHVDQLTRQRLNVLTASVNVIIQLPADHLPGFTRVSALTGAQLEAYTGSLAALGDALTGYATALERGDSEQIQVARDRVVGLSRAETELWSPLGPPDRADVRRRVAAQRTPTSTVDHDCDRSAAASDVRTADVDLDVSPD